MNGHDHEAAVLIHRTRLLQAAAERRRAGLCWCGESIAPKHDRLCDRHAYAENTWAATRVDNWSTKAAAA